MACPRSEEGRRDQGPRVTSTSHWLCCVRRKGTPWRAPTSVAGADPGIVGSASKVAQSPVCADSAVRSLESVPQSPVLQRRCGFGVRRLAAALYLARRTQPAVWHAHGREFKNHCAASLMSVMATAHYHRGQESWLDMSIPLKLYSIYGMGGRIHR